MYNKGFTNPYPSGWEDLPSEETPVTAEALQAHTDAIEHIDDYLFNNQIESKADADIVANEFDMATTYNENDYFMYEGVLYKVLVTCQGVEPPDEDFYQPTLISDEFGSGGGSANIAYGTTDDFNAQKDSAPVGTTFLVTDDVNGGGTVPQYDKTVTVVENGSVNYTPTQNGLLSILTDPNVFATTTISENGVVIMNVCNTITVPVRANKTYTTSTAVRIARFAPF